VDVHVDCCREDRLSPAVENVIPRETCPNVDYPSPKKRNVGNSSPREQDIFEYEIASVRHQEYSSGFCFGNS
jgi:hypothetical protein